MKYRIEYQPVVYGDVAGMPANLQRRLAKAIDARLGGAPDRYGERLRKSLTGLWRLRVGDYRVAYVIDEPGKVVTVWAILHRKAVYPAVTKRWKRP